MSVPIIAIIGRPNVGKSTLFNRLLGKRQAIVDPQEGITRDRNYGKLEWCGHPLQLVDTGGYISSDKESYDSLTRGQAFTAIDEADLVLFIVDAKSGVISSDIEIAKIVRKSDKRNILVINKCDTVKADSLQYQFHELGFDLIIPISALNGRSTGDLLDEILLRLNINSGSKAKNKNINDFNLAIVGRPNVGKSSLTNALLQKERTIVAPKAGTTRDAVDVNLRWHGKNIKLIDTAGLRKLSKVKDRVEYYSALRTKSAIERANVVAVMIDAETGFGKQDKFIIDNVIRSGKGMLIILNKWDLVDKDTSTAFKYKEHIINQYSALKNYPIIFISCLTKQRIHRVIEMSWIVFQNSKVNIPTSKLNAALESIINKNPCPVINGKTLKIKYATQVSNQPFVLALYTNIAKGVKEAYVRYIENQLRLNFDISGIPIRISFRKK